MKWAYYSEFDSKKAAWLRELIKAGVIADGEVDERSIELVHPDDLRGFRRVHCFAGVAVWDYALRLAGWPDDREVWTGSCPCTPFSQAGKRRGKADERHLFPAWFRLIAERRPRVVFAEQVSSPDGLAWLDDVRSDLEGAGYACGALDLCSPSVGAPNIRQRLYIAAESMAGTAGVGRHRWRAGEAGGEPGAVERPERLRDAVGMVGPESHGRTGRAHDSDGGRRERASGPAGAVEFVEQPAPNGRQHDAPFAGVDGKGNRACEPWEQSGAGRFPEFLGGSNGAGPQGRGERRDGGCERAAGAAGVAGGVEYADGGITGYGDLQRSGQFGLLAPSDGTGPCNGFWAGCDWVLTRPERVGDSPCLRPVEGRSLAVASSAPPDLGLLRGSGVPELEKLAEEWESGFPLSVGGPARVLRLRGYGDAINAEVAAAFVRAYLEAK